MKRDIELIRQILLTIEDADDSQFGFDVCGYETKEVHHNLELLISAGLGSVHTMRIGVIIGEWNSHKTSTNASILSYQYSVEM